MVEEASHFKFFKDCLPQILLGPFLITLSQSLLYLSDINLLNSALSVVNGALPAC